MPTRPQTTPFAPRQIFSFVVSIAAVTFLVKAIHDNWDQLRSIDLQFNAQALVPLILFVVAVPLSGVFWGQILSKLVNSEIDQAEAALVHTKSWLLKYVPGQVGSVLGKMFWGAEHGFSRSKIALSFFYENVLHALSSFTLSLPIIFLLLPNVSGVYAFLVPLVILGQVVMLTSDVSTKQLTRLANKLSGRNLSIGDNSLLGGRDLVSFQIKYYLPRLINAAGFALLANQYFAVTSASQFTAIGATYVLAGILGILAFMVPSGVGVREAVIVVLLSGYFTEAEALTLAILGRAYATVADLVLLAIYAYFRNDYKGL